MSYQDYSEQAAREIMSKLSNSQKKEKESTTHNLSIVNQKSLNKKNEAGFKAKDYQYNHPTTAEINRINDTHIYIEKWFESELSEDTIWNEIIKAADETFSVEATVKESPSRKKWKYVNFSNHETVVTLSKNDRFAKLNIIQRVGFWSSKVEGILHGSYTSLILFGCIFAFFSPSGTVSVGIFALLWMLCAFIIYRLSLTSRKNKKKRMTDFASKIIGRILSE